MLEHTGKYMKHSTKGRECLSEDGNKGERLAQWSARLGGGDLMGA
jgi:hypothetical protein